MTAIAEAAAMLRDAQRVVVFTGAGVSQESGIDTFRGGAPSASDGGLWSRYPPDEVATPGGLARMMATDPARLARFLVELLGPVVDAAPNAGHAALARLERAVIDRGGTCAVVTQNVDALHQAAGSARVLEIHGSLFQIVDADGRRMRELSRADLRRVVDELRRAQRGLFRRVRIVSALAPLVGVPRVSSSRTLSLSHRPSVVLFGEALPEPDWSRAVDAAARADVLVVVGTSGLVYPAATLPERAQESGAHIVGVGPDEGDADVWLKGPSGIVLPELVERALTQAG